MKKVCLLIICMLLFWFPSIIFAHTHLLESNPAQGQVVVEELKEITLTFDGNIEKLSSMKVLKQGTELAEIQVNLEVEKMVGVLAEPLENGTYIIQWNIAGEDGHPISGEINFTVQKEVQIEEQSPSVTNEGQETSDSSLVDNDEGNKDVQIISTSGNVESDEIEKQGANNSSQEKGISNTKMIMTIIGFVVILGVGLLLIRKKNKS